MDGTAVTAITTLAQEAAGRVVTIDGKEYSTTPLHDPRTQLSLPRPLTVHTLTGFVAYYKADFDAFRRHGLVAVQVVSPSTVRLVGPVQGDFNQRFTWVEAEAGDRLGATGGFSFGKWYSAEEMNIAMQALFENVLDRPNVLGGLSNVKQSAELTTDDDGVSQRVTAVAGAVLKHHKSVPNPVHLAPFRTFVEVKQPDSPFIFRAREQPGGGVNFALFEADGGAWKRRAVESVAAWLHVELPDAIVLA